jgi:hypothetical protein
MKRGKSNELKKMNDLIPEADCLVLKKKPAKESFDRSKQIISVIEDESQPIVDDGTEEEKTSSKRKRKIKLYDIIDDTKSVIKRKKNRIKKSYEESETFIVESIQHHKGTQFKKEQMTFRVKWEGYNEETWEPWDNLKDNVILHNYLRSIKLMALIPKKYL